MQKQNGFTLVELAISLMVIGLLIGGVLKGQELMENSNINKIIRDINAFEAATVLFNDKYDALPGDIADTSKFDNCTGACLTPGDENGIINSNHETTNFFAHLEKAGYVQMKWEDGYSLAVNAWGGPYRPVHWDAFDPTRRASVPRGNFLTMGDQKTLWAAGAGYHMRTTRTAALDVKMDDGKPRTGNIQINVFSAAQTACFDGSTLDYYPDKSLTSCNPVIYLDGFNP